MIFIYKIIGIILIPIIKINIKLRIKKNKEIRSRYKERYGYSNFKFKDKKKIIWIHAASLGEFKSSDYFIKKYSQNFNILVTTTTVSAAEYAIKNYSNIIHQFAPLDIDIWVNKFLDKWNPSFIIWIESDLWPIILHNIKKRKIKAVLINLRLSPKSLNRWRFFPSFYDKLLNSFNEVFVQSEADKKRISILTKKEMKYIGNLKLITSKQKINEKNLFNIKKESHLKFLMLTSTHSNEEYQLLPIIKQLLKEYKNLRLIIAPRHPERSKEILSLYNSLQIKTHLLSEKKINQNSVTIIDSFGNLPNYFDISDIVFLGGSFIAAGGHNPVEPSSYKCALLTGPHIFNWENIYDDMINKDACLKVKSIEDLKISLKNLLDNENNLNYMKTNAYNFSQNQFVDTISIDSIINKYLKIC